MSYVGCGWCPLCHYRLFLIVGDIEWCNACFDKKTNVSYNRKYQIWKFNGVSYSTEEMLRLCKLKAFL